MDKMDKFGHQQQLSDSAAAASGQGLHQEAGLGQDGLAAPEQKQMLHQGQDQEAGRGQDRSAAAARRERAAAAAGQSLH